MVGLAEANDTMQDGLLHGVKVWLGRLQTCVQLVFPLPFLQATTPHAAEKLHLSKFAMAVTQKGD